MIKSKVLVTGAGGLLGGEYRRVLAGSATYEPIFTERSDLDITDEQAVKNFVAKFKPNVIINCAAYNNVDEAEKDSAEAHEVNEKGVMYLAEAAENLAATLVHYSSNFVFNGWLSDGGYYESDGPNPLNKYGVSKLRGEYRAFANCSRSFVVRTAWLYGQQGTSTSSKETFNDKMLNFAKSRNFITAPTDELGQPTWTRSLATATLSMIEDPHHHFGLFHLVSSGNASRYDWVKELYRLNKVKTPLEGVLASDLPSNVSRPLNGLLHNSKMTGFIPDWKAALGKYYKQAKVATAG